MYEKDLNNVFQECATVILIKVVHWVYFMLPRAQGSSWLSLRTCLFEESIQSFAAKKIPLVNVGWNRDCGTVGAPFLWDLINYYRINKSHNMLQTSNKLKFDMSHKKDFHHILPLVFLQDYFGPHRPLVARDRNGSGGISSREQVQEQATVISDITHSKFLKWCTDFIRWNLEYLLY